MVWSTWFCMTFSWTEGLSFNELHRINVLKICLSTSMAFMLINHINHIQELMLLCIYWIQVEFNKASTIHINTSFICPYNAGKWTMQIWTRRVNCVWMREPVWFRFDFEKSCICQFADSLSNYVNIRKWHTHTLTGITEWIWCIQEFIH